MFDFFNCREFEVGDKVRFKNFGVYDGDVRPETYGIITYITADGLHGIIDIYNTPEFEVGWKALNNYGCVGYRFRDLKKTVERW